MSKATNTIAVRVKDVPPRTKPSHYPAPFLQLMERREKRQLGDQFGLENFGVNLTTLAPGGASALLHKHTRQDEFIYILEGTPTLVTEDGEVALEPGMCAGFPAGGTAHHLLNRTDNIVTYLEIGDRSPNDEASYPNDDIAAVLGADGKWTFTHKDGSPY